MIHFLVYFVSGVLFALGLGLSGMTQPQKVIGFLDLFGTWNPALAFVMIGAISVHAVFYFLFKKKDKPLLNKTFHLPQKQDVDSKLLGGAALFGVGWGLGGFCPGPAMTALVSGQSTVIVFVLSMLVGMVSFKLLKI